METDSADTRQRLIERQKCGSMVGPDSRPERRHQPEALRCPPRSIFTAHTGVPARVAVAGII
jgi:hypothetical protein